MAKKKPTKNRGRGRVILTRAHIEEAQDCLLDLRDCTRDLLKREPQKALNILNGALRSMDACLGKFENKYPD